MVVRMGTPNALPVQLRCSNGHRLTCSTIPHIHRCRCHCCRNDIPRTTTRFCCRWCKYHVCYECGMQFNIQSEKSRANLRKGTFRTMLRSRVSEKQKCRELSVAISKYYDIVNPGADEMRVHCHSRKGLCIAEDCHFAAFSAARLDLTISVGCPSYPSGSLSLECSARDLAEFIVRRGMLLVDIVGAEVSAHFDCPDKKWKPNLPEGNGGSSILAWMVGGGDVLQKVRTICFATQEILQSQPVVTEVAAPAKVFGDIHGQLRDLLLLMHYYGRPGGETVVGRSQVGASAATRRSNGSARFHPPVPHEAKTPTCTSRSTPGSPTFSRVSSEEFVEVSYIFNGDWVDRGRHQLEVVMLLFALKIIYPSSVWLNRGNHEDIGQNMKTSRKGSLGFDRACEAQLGQTQGSIAFNEIHRVFDWLPLAARVGHKILVLHGGLGGGEWTLEDLKGVQRPLPSCDLATVLEGAVYNVLWSDPIAPDHRNPARTYGVHPSHRAKHGSVMKGFGRDVTERFCRREQLGLIIRSHQFKQSGKGYELHHDGWLMRVFSARNYCGESSNDGGVLLIGTAEGEPEILLVRPQNLERMAKAVSNRGQTPAEIAATLGLNPAEPYCQRGHLMHLVEPRPPSGFFSLSRLCGDRMVNAECNLCGAERLEVGRFYTCRACCDFDLCLGCARQEGRSAEDGGGGGAEERLNRYTSGKGIHSPIGASMASESCSDSEDSDDFSSTFSDSEPDEDEENRDEGLEVNPDMFCSPKSAAKVLALSTPSQKGDRTAPTLLGSRLLEASRPGKSVGEEGEQAGGAGGDGGASASRPSEIRL